MKRIDLVIPCYNEAENIGLFLQTAERIIAALPYRFHFIFVDDGSQDNTFHSIRDQQQGRDDISIYRFTRNFGKEAALAAGLEVSQGDAVILIDADLQHPPKLIPLMIEKWEEGFDIVDAVKQARERKKWIGSLMSNGFNGIMNRLTGMDFTGASDFKLLDRRAVAVLNQLHEKTRFYRGLTNWIGFSHARLYFRVESRRYGETKWNWLKLIQLSMDAITSYSSKPLQIVTLLGVAAFMFSVLLGMQTLYNKFFGGADTGFTTVILAILLMSSIIMISIGILGLYISKIYKEVKNRPIFIINRSENLLPEQDLKKPVTMVHKFEAKPDGMQRP